MNRKVLIICAESEMQKFGDGVLQQGGDLTQIHFLVGLMRPEHPEDLADHLAEIEETIRLVAPRAVIVDPCGYALLKPPPEDPDSSGALVALRGGYEALAGAAVYHNESLREPLDRLCWMLERVARELGFDVII